MKTLLLNLTLFFLFSTCLFAQHDKKSTITEADISKEYNIVRIPFEKCKDSVTVSIENITAEFDSVQYCYTNQNHFTNWGLHSFKVEEGKLKFTVREFRPFDELAIQFLTKRPGRVRIEYRRY